MSRKYSSIYSRFRGYEAYLSKTDEKKLLQEEIEKTFEKDFLKNILDIGGGDGIHSRFLSERFSNSLVYYIEPSKVLFDLAISNGFKENVSFWNTSLENFKVNKKFDLILVSHVLQYLDSSLEEFIRKCISLLNVGGEIWVINQTKKGMARIIGHQVKFLDQRLFSNWRTAEDFFPLVERLIDSRDFSINFKVLDTSIENINFSNPSLIDKFRLEFILGLERDLDSQSKEFKDNLSKLKFEGKRINHPNKIMIIKKNP